MCLRELYNLDNIRHLYRRSLHPRLSQAAPPPLAHPQRLTRLQISIRDLMNLYHLTESSPRHQTSSCSLTLKLARLPVCTSNSRAPELISVVNSPHMYKEVNNKLGQCKPVIKPETLQHFTSLCWWGIYPVSPSWQIIFFPTDRLTLSLLISVPFLIVRGTSSLQSGGSKCSPAAGHSGPGGGGKVICI